jgi:hypothetical protein
MVITQLCSSTRAGRAEAFKRGIPGALARFFDAGYFALETHAAEIAAAIRDIRVGSIGSC